MGAGELGNYKGATGDLGDAKKVLYPVVAMVVQESAHDKMTLNCTHTVAMTASCYGTILELCKYTINGGKLGER